ncbi:hypothetical protein C8Q75DRAFT_720912 [Abortiporus biennis]|nr:hypothetical protein C8Q75DRAFT_720912 [Abortiporus biennis]
MSAFMPSTLNPATLLSRRFRPNQIPNLTGRVALVTGGSAGIGYFDALALARANARVLIVSSNEDKGKQVKDEINQNILDNNGHGSVEWYGADFGNLKAVDTLSKKLAGELDRLDILICNAGIGQTPYGLTADGLEKHFEINNLSHYVFTLRLLPLMQKTAGSLASPAQSRIVMQSSELHRFSPSSTTFLSKDEINKKGDGSQLYGRTKLGFIYFAKQLVKRKISSMEKPIVVTSVHPGTVDTELQQAWVESYGNIVGKLIERMTIAVAKSAPEGAEASLWAATSPDIHEGNWKNFQGNYYTEADGKPGQESALAKDEAVGDNYWELCARLTKELLGEEIH